MQRVKHIFMMTWFLFIAGIVSVFGQLKFHVASFGEDQFDLAARDERFKKIDGSGALYAIIKVSGDDLKEYNFNFGNMNHLVESHEDQLWVYVQKNAKQVTITRSGYNPLRNYDLRTTIEAGKTYRMQLSAQGPVIMTQMVMFQVKPADARATIMMRREGYDTQEEVFGITDTEGRVANPLEYGTYTYRVMATNYHSTEGRITLNNQDETHVENVNLRSNGAVITLSVAQDAEIYVNGARKGVRSWKGLLKAGNYQVECRQVNHRPSSQNITVTEGKDEVVTLVPPTPITGRLSVNSSPLNAAIKVGGRVLGNTPKIIPDMLIGRHEIVLSREGYDDAAATVDVKEGETCNVNLTLKEKPSGPVVSRYPKPESDVDKNIPVAQKQAENTFAFIICNENYADAPVPYSLNDGRMFKEYCQKALGLPEKNINMYEDATFGNIITAIEKMKSIADAYDGEASVIFYYAGHGFPDDKQQTAYLLPIDGDASSITTTGYPLAKLYKEIAGLNLKSSIVFLDACFSGSKRGEGMLASARGVAIKAKPQAPQGNMVVFSAAQGDETAYPYKEKGHGLFTYYLLKGIQNAGGDPDMGTLTEYVTMQVKRLSVVINKKQQTPTVIPSQSLSGTWQTMKLR